MTLLATLEARQTRLLETERRARYERESIRTACTMLRVGITEDEVAAKLKAKGVRLETAQ